MRTIDELESALRDGGVAGIGDYDYYHSALDVAMPATEELRLLIDIAKVVNVGLFDGSLKSQRAIAAAVLAAKAEGLFDDKHPATCDCVECENKRDERKNHDAQ